MTDCALADVMQALPPATAPLVERVCEVAERTGCRVHLVGGPVRDWLLDRAVLDVDLIVDAGGEPASATLARAAAPEGAQVTVHDRFGTASIETEEGRVDLADLRREHYRHAGALPKVEAGTLEEDLARRDFSINALAVPLVPSASDGRTHVVDRFEGLRDLERRRLRVLHERSFHDDPTRALRAARLAPRLGFSLSRGSRTHLRDALRDGAFSAVSGDRLRRELEKVFTDATLGLNPADALKRLASWHVLAALEPGLALPTEAHAPLRRLGRGIQQAPWRGPRMRPWVSGLSIWLGPLPAALRRRALSRFSVRGETARRIAAFPRARDGWLKRLANARGRGSVDSLLSGIDEEQLMALWAEAPTPIRRRVVRWAAEDRGRRVPVSGSDLLEIGLEGPAVGRALGRIRAAFLDGAVANREEALALGRELGRRSSGRRGVSRGRRKGA